LDKDKLGNADKLGKAFKLTGMGWYVALCILGSLFLGIWLDGLLGTRVLFTFLGLALGLAAAFYGVYRMISDLFAEKPETKEAEGS